MIGCPGTPRKRRKMAATSMLRAQNLTIERFASVNYVSTFKLKLELTLHNIGIRIQKRPPTTVKNKQTNNKLAHTSKLSPCYLLEHVILQLNNYAQRNN